MSRCKAKAWHESNAPGFPLLLLACKAFGISWSLTSRVCVCVCAVDQSCLSLCDSVDCSPPGSSVHGIFQARILEWVAISFSRGSSWPRDWNHTSCFGRRILYHWGTREDHWLPIGRLKSYLPLRMKELLISCKFLAGVKFVPTDSCD